LTGQRREAGASGMCARGGDCQYVAPRSNRFLAGTGQVLALKAFVQGASLRLTGITVKPIGRTDDLFASASLALGDDEISGGNR